MKRMRVSDVYYVKGSTDDQRCADRLGRMLPFIEADSVKEATLEELDALFARLGPDMGRPRHPYLFFGQFKQWTPAQEQELCRKYPNLQGWLSQRIRGSELLFTAGGFNNVRDGYICRPLWSLDPTLGCFHACTYCCFCDMTALGMTLNVEELIDHVREAMRLVPWQKNWHNGGATDIFCFEPEYGYTEQVLDIAAAEDRNVLFFTSTDNVDFLGDLKNRDRAIIEWTISPHALVKWERKAPGLAARLQAMKKCKEFGCTVRCQFAPFVPLADWRGEYHRMIGELFAVVEPDFIAMHMVRNCPHPVSATLRRWFGPNGIDPEYMAMVEEAEKDGGVASFPAGHVLPAHGRETMYRFVIDEIRALCPDIPIVLCRETPDMWKHFQADLLTDPANCGCGSLPRG